MNRDILDKDLQQLSAYLDDQLSEKERTQIEARMQSLPELREELEGLRRTKILLRQAPKRRAPRNFFLTAEMAPKRASLQLFPVFRLTSALAGLLLVVAFAGDLLFGFAPLRAASGPMALQSAPQNAARSSEGNPLLFTWGLPTPIGATGLGGSGGGGTGGAEGSGLPIGGKGGGPPAGDTLLPTVTTDNSASPTPENTPAASLALAPTDSAPKAAATPPSVLSAAPLSTQPASTQEALTPGAYQSGPVLGINPVEGAANSTQIAVLHQIQSQPIQLPRPTMHIVEGGLALLLALAGLAAFYFHRREN